MRINIEEVAETLNLGDVEFFERESGLTMEELAAGRYNTAAVIALIVIQQRRSDPSFTMDDARAIPVSELEIVQDPQAPKRRAKAAS